MNRNYAVSGRLLILDLGQVRQDLGMSLHPYPLNLTDLLQACQHPLPEADRHSQSTGWEEGNRKMGTPLTTASLAPCW